LLVVARNEFEFRRRGFFDAVDGEPGFVAAGFVLARGWELPKSAVGEFDDDGSLEGTALLDLESDLGEHLEGQRRKTQVADAKGLGERVDSLGPVNGVPTKGGSCPGRPRRSLKTPK
jgi:hypothetical protein